MIILRVFCKSVKASSIGINSLVINHIIMIECSPFAVVCLSVTGVTESVSAEKTAEFGHDVSAEGDVGEREIRTGDVGVFDGFAEVFPDWVGWPDLGVWL